MNQATIMTMTTTTTTRGHAALKSLASRHLLKGSHPMILATTNQTRAFHSSSDRHCYSTTTQQQQQQQLQRQQDSSTQSSSTFYWNDFGSKDHKYSNHHNSTSAASPECVENDTTWLFQSIKKGKQFYNYSCHGYNDDVIKKNHNSNNHNEWEDCRKATVNTLGAIFRHEYQAHEDYCHSYSSPAAEAILAAQAQWDSLLQQHQQQQMHQQMPKEQKQEGVTAETETETAAEIPVPY